MTPLDVLVTARELIATPERWTKGRNAARTAGGPAYCIDGACIAAWVLLDSNNTATLTDVRERVLAEIGDAPTSPLNPWVGGPVHWWNDAPTTTHGDVLALLDRVIAKERAK